MFRRVFLFALALTVVAHAQDAGGSGLTVRFLAERAPGNLGKVVLAAEKARSEPFELPINHLSDPRVAPARVFSIRPEAKDLSIADVTLPDAGKSFIVLLIPAVAGGYQPVVISAEDPDFKPGDVYFYNHADKPVLGYVGTSKFILAPAKGQTLRPAGAKPEKYYDVGFGVREKEGDRALSTTRWPVDDKIRSYVFFFVNPGTKRLDFRAVDEFVPPEKPAP
ncbi:MAG: hypothetical protein B9S38_00585 [Verrucomicrobiia bacterium Tous-C4TDCM]|nr:MAG: hypothetical protein B9S38_00585 [Verrucomicrobiae bacterium Tous-C4TDCM]